MADYRRSEIVSGLFVVVAVVVFALFAFRIEGLDPLAFVRQGSVACRAFSRDVKTLESGAKVAVAGQRVGSVRAIRILPRPQSEVDIAWLRALDGEAFAALQAGWLRQVIEIEFEIDDPNLRLDPQTASVRIAQDGFLGRHFLALDPGFWAPGREPQPLLTARVEPPLMLATREGGGLDELLVAVQPILRRLENVLGKLDEDLLNESNLARAGQAIDDLADALAALREALADDNPSGLRREVIEPLGKVLREAGDLLAANRPQIDKLLGELGEAASGLGERIARIETDLRALLGAASGTIDDNRAELAETARRLRRTMWEAEMALRKIRANPALLLFGDSEPDLDERPVDNSGLHYSGRVVPFRQRDEKEGRR
jgi:ABC-type transporter Mla subunit MlaD